MSRRRMVTRLSLNARRYWVIEAPVPEGVTYPERYEYQEWTLYVANRRVRLTKWQAANGYQLFDQWYPYETVPWIDTLPTHKVMELVSMETLANLARFRKRLEEIESEEVIEEVTFA